MKFQRDFFVWHECSALPFPTIVSLLPAIYRDTNAGVEVKLTRIGQLGLRITLLFYYNLPFLVSWAMGGDNPQAG
jgi:hypothetical protein